MTMYYNITKKQAEVLRLKSRGYEFPEGVAKKLGISPTAVILRYDGAKRKFKKQSQL